MHKVNIVIPVYNGQKYLENLYQSLKAGISNIDYVITLVDDYSSDSTRRWARNHLDINYIKNKANLGFAKTCNKGASSIDSEWILFLNQDIIAESGFLKEMLTLTEISPFPQIVGAKLLTPDKKIIQHAGIKFMASGYPYEYGRNEAADSPDYSINYEIDGVTGAAMLVKKNLFNRLNGFDEDFINGWEDIDLCLRAKELGIHIYYCAKAVLVHYLYSSQGRFTHERENKLLFKDKWINHRRVNVLTPFWMAIAATWACNLRCQHCNIWKKNSNKVLDIAGFELFIA
ncbi:MAG: glycosyltransferase family 2 protein, partial [Promethearchaeota archaeon]